jgi:hypothetical protein
MKNYIGVKLVKAKPMNRGDYNAYRGWQLPEDENGADEGYLVELVDSSESNHTDHEGYISWSPKKQFEEFNQSVEGMTFGHAIECLKKGLMVARQGWNGKGMFLFYLPAGKIPKSAIHDGALKSVVEQVEGDYFEALGSIRMWTADKKVLTGWLASQTDMLAEDWVIVDKTQ